MFPLNIKPYQQPVLNNVKPYQQPVLNLAPSRAEQWLSCPLSAVLSRELRGSYSGCYSGQVITSHNQKEEEFIEQGVLAHKLAEETINYLYFGGERKLQTSKIIEQAVRDYTLMLQHYVLENNGDIVMFRAEKPVEIELDEESKKSGLTCQGTVDAALLTTQSIHVFDLKYGENEPVDAKNNAQLMLYAVGLYQAYKPLNPSINCIVLHIIQPRQEYKYSDYQLSDVQLMSWFNNTVLPVCHEIGKLDINRVMANPSVETCKNTHCEAYECGRCNKCKNWALNKLSASSSVIPTDEELYEEVHLRSFLNGYMDNSRDMTVEEMKNGRVINGVTCESKEVRGMPKSKKGKQAVLDKLGSMYLPELAGEEYIDHSPKPLYYFEQRLGKEKTAKVFGDVLDIQTRNKLKLIE